MKVHRSAPFEVRRADLVRRSGRLRANLADNLEVTQPFFRVADRVRDGVCFARRNRVLTWGAVAVLMAATVRRPARAAHLGLRALSAWELYQRAQPLARSVWRRLV